jgi:hypothetical protein
MSNHDGKLILKFDSSSLAAIAREPVSPTVEK